jgi:predicted HTH transcriptional regulator
MPFDRQLAEQRARRLIDSRAELTGVEYKRDADFPSLKFRITKTAMAMANLRDGGMIIIGVSQDQQRQFSADGVSATNEASFIQEDVYEFVNLYASPPVEVHAFSLEHQLKKFIIIDVQPFERTPIVCRRNTPDGTQSNDQMHEGDFFVRVGSPVSTQRVKSDAMMHEVLEFAVIRRLAEVQRIQRTATTSNEGRNVFDAEVADLDDI